MILLITTSRLGQIYAQVNDGRSVKLTTHIFHLVQKFRMRRILPSQNNEIPILCNVIYYILNMSLNFYEITRLHYPESRQLQLLLRSRPDYFLSSVWRCIEETEMSLARTTPVKRGEVWDNLTQPATSSRLFITCKSFIIIFKQSENFNSVMTMI